MQTETADRKNFRLYMVNPSFRLQSFLEALRSEAARCTRDDALRPLIGGPQTGGPVKT